jgi:dephospho-CoA kinase
MTLKLGLTGGIGSGKSTVAAMLARLSATLLDADAISRQASAAGGAAIPVISQMFGAEFIASDGSLNRDAMRSLVFTDPGAKARLEAIIHPIVGREMALLEQQAVASACRLLVFDIPLLVESPRWRPRLDLVMVVDCELETQILRVMQRSGWSREQVQQVVTTQAGRALRLSAADVVICNEGIDIHTLEQQVQQWAHRFGL